METIRTALAMGADKGIHICDPAFDGADAYVTASALAAAIKGVPYDIIFCGQRAIDDDSAQVGAILAELLGIPQITVVTKFEFTDGAVKAIRPIEGAQLLIECPLPCVVTAQKGLNEPRYASLPGIMKAKKKPVDVKDAAALGVSADTRQRSSGLFRLRRGPRGRSSAATALRKERPRSWPSCLGKRRR